MTSITDELNFIVEDQDCHVSSNPVDVKRTYGTIGGRHNDQESRVKNQLPQYTAVLSATLSAMSAGIVLAWTSPILTVLESGHYHNIAMNASQVGWIGSVVPLGALLTCIPAGFLCDLIGRRTTLLLLIIPYSLGWSLIIWADSLTMLCLGRFITGIAAGACCVAAPLYVSEVSQREIRGRLGSYFQLMIVMGIFYAYLLGKYMEPTRYTTMCLVVPVLFFVSFINQPESPIHYLKQARFDDAQNSLSKLRNDQDVTEELMQMEASVKESQRIRVEFRTVLARKSFRRAMVIASMLMFFQQFCGINAIIFYTASIFKMSNIGLDAGSSTILVGFCKIVSTFASSVFIEKLGRRWLLLFSDFVMALATLSLGIFFSIRDHQVVSDDTMAKLGVIPVIAICVFVIVFSLGYGPIPWLISGELFTSDVKSMSSAVAGTLNWLFAFFITKFYLEAQMAIGSDNVFYFFTLISLMGTCFVYFIVPETRGKSIEEIQVLLEQ